MGEKRERYFVDPVPMQARVSRGGYHHNIQRNFGLSNNGRPFFAR